MRGSRYSPSLFSPCAISVLTAPISVLTELGFLFPAPRPEHREINGGKDEQGNDSCVPLRICGVGSLRQSAGERRGKEERGWACDRRDRHTKPDARQRHFCHSAAAD